MRFIRLASFFALCVVLFGGGTAWSFPLTSRNWNPGQATGILDESVFGTDGIIGLANCSASLVRFKGASDEELALVLTNGHCVRGRTGGMPGPGEVIVDRPVRTRMSLYNKDGSRLATLSATRIVYATMTGTDAALLELDQSYAEIERRIGVAALIMNDQVSPLGLEIEVASGYWRRSYRCRTEALVPLLREGAWTLTDSIRYSAQGCDVIGGTSGSPIVSRSSGEVIGVNNTVNENGGRCTLNNPCEVEADGTVRVIRGRGYGQQTYLFYGCLGRGVAAERLDLSRPDCRLAKP